MSENRLVVDFDVGIVGGGPAGLNAAVVLGRCRRRVILFDQGKPRNHATHAVHCYLGLDGIAPHALREQGRSEAYLYGVQILDAEVTSARRLSTVKNQLGAFEVHTAERSFIVRTLLLTTGVVDVLPDIPNIKDFYGRSVHHCPYCDGWEHRDKKLVALGKADSVIELAASLRTWSGHVTACSNGQPLSAADRRFLVRNDVMIREEKITRLSGKNGALEEVIFETGPPHPCHALFFSSGQAQRSQLPSMLGCKTDDKGLIRTGKKQGTGVPGLYLAGDADGEVQFAIVAAAEGAIAATAINRLLEEENKS